MRSAAVRTLGGVGLTAALLAGVGSGLFHVGRALAGPGPQRADMTAVGVDPTPVGTAKQVDRLKRARAAR